MENIVPKLMIYLEIAIQILGAIVLISTGLVRITSTKKDDEYLSKFKIYLNRFLSYLPTLGLNPKTKAIMEANKHMQDEIEKLKAKDEHHS